METWGLTGAHAAVSCVTRTRRWPADMVASFEDRQTNHCFKGHFKRHSDRRADGAWKKPCASFYFPTCNHSVWSARSFGFCDAWKCCARVYKAPRRVQTVTHAKNLKTILKSTFVSSRVSSLSSGLTTYPWSKNLPNGACNLPSAAFCKRRGTYAECLCWSTLKHTLGMLLMAYSKSSC